MKKILSFAFILSALLLSMNGRSQQAFKVGVFDIGIMVQAMPGYIKVDSLMQIYDRDSLGSLREYYESEFQRLDSTYKADSASMAAGKKSKAIVDMVFADRQKAMINIVYWQQIAQNKSNEKRNNLSKELSDQVLNAYRKVLARKKYTLVLKPQTYELGFKIDNVFIAVARELKLTELPQDLLYLGDDPDPKPQTTQQKPPATKPKG